MALTTTTDYASNILSEVLNDSVLGALDPKVVYWQWMNQDNIDGEPTLQKDYPRHSKLGAAIAGSEGTDFSTITSMAFDAPIQAIPTEGAIARADLTTRAIRRQNPSVTNREVFARLQAGDFSGILGLIEDEAQRLMSMLWQKVETDSWALLDDFTDSQGSIITDLSVADTLAAMFDMEINDTEHDSLAWFWSANMLSDIRAELLVTSGATGSTWTQWAQTSLVNLVQDTSQEASQGRGFRGEYLGARIYVGSEDTNPKPGGTGRAGALVATGQGRPSRSGQNGASVFTEGHAPDFLLDVDPSARSIELIAVWEYAINELRDEHGVGLLCINT